MRWTVCWIQHNAQLHVNEYAGAGYVNNNYSRRMRSGRQRQPTHTDEPAKQAQVAFDMSSSNKDTCKPQAADSDNNGELVTLDTQVCGSSMLLRVSCLMYAASLLCCKES